MHILRQTACMVVNPVMVDNFALLFNCSTVSRSSDLIPIRILHKSTAGRYRPVRVADGPITARCGFIKNASWDDGPALCFLKVGA